jgi:hypothetical protein
MFGGAKHEIPLVQVKFFKRSIFDSARFSIQFGVQHQVETATRGVATPLDPPVSCFKEVFDLADADWEFLICSQVEWAGDRTEKKGG